jgi:hypothetical protein
MSALLGKTIVDVRIKANQSRLAFLTDDGWIVFEAVGDCCAHAYFYQIEGIEDVIGHTITEVRSCELPGTEDDYGVTDVAFISLVAAPYGQACIEFRTEHNGYYCGWPELLLETPEPEALFRWARAARERAGT